MHEFSDLYFYVTITANHLSSPSTTWHCHIQSACTFRSPTSITINISNVYIYPQYIKQPRRHHKSWIVIFLLQFCQISPQTRLTKSSFFCFSFAAFPLDKRIVAFFQLSEIDSLQETFNKLLSHKQRTHIKSYVLICPRILFWKLVNLGVWYRNILLHGSTVLSFSLKTSHTIHSPPKEQTPNLGKVILYKISHFATKFDSTISGCFSILIEWEISCKHWNEIPPFCKFSAPTEGYAFLSSLMCHRANGCPETD